MSSPITPLAQDFPVPTREQWEALALRALRGAPLESLTTTTPDGVIVEPLYGPSLEPARAAAQTHARCGDNPWDIRVPVAHPDPARANAEALEALEGGASSILLRVAGPGHSGCAIRSAEDMARALQGVAVETATVALDGGFGGPEAAGWLAAVAKASPAARLAFHLDPLSAFAEAGRSPGPIQGHVEAAASVGAGLAATYPDATLFLASGRVVHEAGGSPAQELGVMLAAALAYARAMTGAGLSMPQALGAIVLGLAVDAGVFVSIAKLRAARDLWDRFARACGAPLPARMQARTSTRMLTREDAWTNLLRLTVAGFAAAAAAGGADVIVLDAFTDALGRPARLARRLARNTQLILMQEAHLGRIADPAAGSWCVEALTEQLARDGWTAFQGIEGQGGLADALISGSLAAEVAAVRDGRRLAVQTGAARIVGVTAFRDSAPVAPEVEIAPTREPASTDGEPGRDSVCPPLARARTAEPFEAPE